MISKISKQIWFLTLSLFVLLVAVLLVAFILIKDPSRNGIGSIQNHEIESNLSNETPESANEVPNPTKPSNHLKGSNQKNEKELTDAELEAILQWLAELDLKDKKQIAHQTVSNVSSEAIDGADEEAKAKQTKISELQTQIQELKQQMYEVIDQDTAFSREQDAKYELFHELEAERMAELRKQRKMPKDQQDATQLLLNQKMQTEVLNEINELYELRDPLLDRLHNEFFPTMSNLKEELESLQAEGEK